MAAHPGVADHQVLDRGPLGVPEVERSGDVRRRLDDRERRKLRIGGRASAIGRKDVRREPPLVDRSFDVARSVGLFQVGHLLVPRRSRENERPARPADERVVVPPAGSASGPATHRGRPGSGALSTRYRASTVMARERPSRRLTRAAHTVPRSLRGRPVATLLGQCRETASLAPARSTARQPLRRRNPDGEVAGQLPHRRVGQGRSERLDERRRLVVHHHVAGVGDRDDGDPGRGESLGVDQRLAVIAADERPLDRESR